MMRTCFCFSGLLLLVILTVSPPAEAEMWPTSDPDTVPYCPILDDLSKPVYELGLTVIDKSRFEGFGKSAMIELDADWEFAYFRNILVGDVDCNVDTRSTIFLDSTGLDLPSQVAFLALDLGWTHRGRGGVSGQLRLKPGIYSDLETLGGDAWNIPFSMSGIRAFNTRLSGIVGLDVRPGFERPILPLIGLVWEAHDRVRVDARLPRSRLDWFISRDLSTNLAFEWRNMSYALDDDRDMVTVEDFRLSWAVTYRTRDDLQFTAEVGHCYERSVEFDDVGEDNPDTFDVGNATTFRFALGGPF